MEIKSLAEKIEAMHILIREVMLVLCSHPDSIHKLRNLNQFLLKTFLQFRIYCKLKKLDRESLRQQSTYN